MLALSKSNMMGEFIMNRLFNNLKNIFAVIIIIILVVSYFGVYLPLKGELEAALEENFSTLVSVSEIFMEDHLGRAVEGAESLSSRTMIRKKLIDYHNNQISLEELREYTHDKYEDGVESFNYALGAYRFSDGQQIASCGSDFLSIIENSGIKNNDADCFNITSDQKYILVKSVIKNEQGKNIGSDYLLYDLSAILAELKKLHSEEIIYSVSRDRDNVSISQQPDNKMVEYKRLLESDYFLKAEINSDLIYEEIKSISYKIILIVLLTTLAVTLIVIKILKKASDNIISKLREDLKKQTRLSQIDEMLGIYNRSKLDEELDREIDRAKRYKNPLSLIMVDIDYFKEFNDNYGHQVGDKILKIIVNKLDEGIRQHDILARYGGDELMIICPETELEDAKKLALRLNKAADNLDCEHCDELSCSFGVAEFDVEADNKRALIKKADNALYQAKEAGRNAVSKNRK